MSTDRGLDVTTASKKCIPNTNDIACYARFFSLKGVFVEHLGLLAMRKTYYKRYFATSLWGVPLYMI